MRTLRKPTRMSLYLSGSQKVESLEACADAGRALRGSTGREEAGMADLVRVRVRVTVRVRVRVRVRSRARAGGRAGREEAGMADLGRCASRLALRVLGLGLGLG